MASKAPQAVRDGKEIPGGGEGRLNVRPPSLQPESGMSGGVRGYQTWPLRRIAASPQRGSRQDTQACRNEPAADAQAAGPQSASERLEAFVAGCGNQPSQRLCSWLNVCGPELADQIHCNILAMADLLFAPSAQFMRIPWQEQQGREEETTVVVLFYKLLEGQLSFEEQRKPSSDFAPLLKSAPFRKSLFACCAVLTAAAYGTPFLDHTAAVEKLGITAFDMGRNIEMLVKACPDLPPEFREHLLAVEEEVLELRAWQAGSSFYSFVINADRCLRSLQAGPSSVAGSSAGSPEFPLPAKLGLSMRGMNIPAFVPINDLFRKVLKLSILRLLEMQRHLEATSAAKITNQIILALQFALYERTRLFYNRHIDQILLCTIYGVCKANGKNITFKELTTCYAKDTNGQAKVFTIVVIRQTEPGLWVQECGDIIFFYNKVFLPAMGNCLLSTAAKWKEERQQGSAAAPPRTPPCEDPSASAPLTNQAFDCRAEQPCVSATEARRPSFMPGLVHVATQECGGGTNAEQQSQGIVNGDGSCPVAVCATPRSKSTDEDSYQGGSKAKRQREVILEQETGSGRQQEGQSASEDDLPYAKRCCRAR